MREVERQPHPLSNVENLSALSLHQLQHAVQHANRLAKNLRSHNPRPTHIRHLSVEAGYEFLVSIGEIFMRRGNTIKARELWQAARPLFIRSSQMGEAIAVDARLKKLSLEVIPPPDPAADQTVVGRSIGQEQLTMSLAPEESLREMMQSSAAIQSHGPVEVRTSFSQPEPLLKRLNQGSTEILQVRPSTDENYASRKALAL
ncbi:hypothetical protein B0H16DRAFT_1583041 [Mycena metata]|uniref:Uncharacterized protein n=1 Tax=Mycena metata TaxID=1033252 RepID=A0AAD7HZD4_9AGAR|nr:hypothetical protein B0H16DRAFT_1583041 [Mycena metata]